VLKRLPTLGLSLGYLFGDRPGLRAMVQYSVSFVVGTNCRSTPIKQNMVVARFPVATRLSLIRLINSKEIARGAGIRQAMRIGGGIHPWLGVDRV